MTPRRARRESSGRGNEAPVTAVRAARVGVGGALQRGRSRLNAYGGEFRLARALLDLLAGLDPGAVRLAQTVLGLLPTRRSARGDAELSPRDGSAVRTRGSAR